MTVKDLIEHYGVDDVLMGSGTLKGFVYLVEELL